MPADLEKLSEKLYAIADTEPVLRNLDEREKDDVVAAAVLDLSKSYTMKPAPDAVTIGVGHAGAVVNLDRIEIGDAEYSEAVSALDETIKDIDSENFSPYDENVIRATAKVSKIRYTTQDELEELLMSDPKLSLIYADNFEIVRDAAIRSGRYAKLGGIDEPLPNFYDRATPKLEPPKKKAEPRAEPRAEPKAKPKGEGWFEKITGAVKAHKKLAGALMVVGAVGATLGGNYVLGAIQSDERVTQLKAHGGTDATARSFEARWGPKLVGPSNRFNSSVLQLYDIDMNNATLADTVYAGARDWGMIGYVAEHLGVPQYLPKTAREAGCFSKLMPVSGITDYPKVLKAYALDSDILLYKIGIAASDDAAAWNGVHNVARYMTVLIRNGTITTDGLDGEDLQRLVMPIQLANTDIRTGQVDGSYNLGTFLRNTTPDASLNGDSPLVWQGKTLRAIKAAGEAWYSDPTHGSVFDNESESWKNLPEKVSEYKTALYWGNNTYANFEYAANAYRESIKNLPDKNDIMFVYGAGIPVGIGEGFNGHYDAIAGMHFGTPVKYRIVNYPWPGTTMYHEDPCIWSKSLHKYVGMFTEVDSLKKNYESTPYEMNLQECGIDGNMVKISD